MKQDADVLNELAAEYYLRDLTEEELNTLQDGLTLVPELRDRFMNDAIDEWLMHHVHQSSLENVIPFPSRRGQTRRWLAVAAGIAILLSLSAVFVKDLAGRSTRTVARVTDCFILSGDAISASNQGRLRVVKQGDALWDGDDVVLPPGSRLTFQYSGEETSVRVNGDTRLSLSDRAGAKHILLSRGQLTADVDKQDSGKPMRITTPDAEAVVLGTTFELSARQVTRLAVKSGCVRFESPEEQQSLDVPSGYLAESDEETGWKSLPYREEILNPSEERTVGNIKKLPGFITVDPVRDCVGYLTFDLGTLNDALMEATLRLRVMRKGSDWGGNGTVRLFVLPSGNIDGECTQISHYIGRVGAGMDLDFDIDPEKLRAGENLLMISQDQGGNDFWFSSSKGVVSPQLMLKVKANHTKGVFYANE